MQFLDLFLIPLAAALEWWTMLWSHDWLIMNVFLGIIFIRLLFRFILDPIFSGDAGSDRADQHPKRK